MQCSNFLGGRASLEPRSAKTATRGKEQDGAEDVVQGDNSSASWLGERACCPQQQGPHVGG